MSAVFSQATDVEITENPVQERVTHSSVKFQNRFSLRGVDGEQPPGTYTIETTEVPIESMSYLAYRRAATTIILPALGSASLSRQVIEIDPTDLESALRRDALTAAIRPNGR